MAKKKNITKDLSIEEKTELMGEIKYKSAQDVIKDADIKKLQEETIKSDDNYYFKFAQDVIKDTDIKKLQEEIIKKDDKDLKNLDNSEEQTF